MPQVSVIIPNYNHARFLEQRIRSVLDQTWPDFEVIYLDDASTDDSNAVFERLNHDGRMQAILNQTNSGTPFKQWNKGVRAARGEYIWLAESDDYADPHLLETLVPVLDQNPDAVLAYCQSWEVNGAGQVGASLIHWTNELDSELWQHDWVESGADICRRFLLHKNVIPNASAVLFRKSIYEAAGGADEKLKLCGDWLMWVKMLLHGKAAFVAKPLNYYRCHDGSVRHNTARNGILLEETYRAVAPIVRRADVPLQVQESLFEDMMKNWFEMAMTQPGVISRSRNKAIFAAGNAADPNFKKRFLKKLTGTCLRRWGLYDSVALLSRGPRYFMRSARKALRNEE